MLDTRSIEKILQYTYLTSHHELHNEEKVFLVFVDVVKLDNIGVVDLFENHDLVLKAHLVFFCKFAPMSIKNNKRQNHSLIKSEDEIIH